MVHLLTGVFRVIFKCEILIFVLTMRNLYPIYSILYYLHRGSGSSESSWKKTQLCVIPPDGRSPVVIP